MFACFLNTFISCSIPFPFEFSRTLVCARALAPAPHDTIMYWAMCLSSRYLGMSTYNQTDIQILHSTYCVFAFAVRPFEVPSRRRVLRLVWFSVYLLQIVFVRFACVRVKRSPFTFRYQIKIRKTATHKMIRTRLASTKYAFQFQWITSKATQRRLSFVPCELRYAVGNPFD